jgi:hypothetical protein
MVDEAEEVLSRWAQIWRICMPADACRGGRLVMFGEA